MPCNFIPLYCSVVVLHVTWLSECRQSGRKNVMNIVYYNYIYIYYAINVNKNPTDATVCRYLFTAKLLYMFRVSQHPSSGVLKTVPAASGTGHTICTATPLQRGLIGTLEWSSGTSSMTCTGGCGYSFQYS